MSHRHVCRAGKDTKWCSSAVGWLQGLPWCQSRSCLSWVSSKTTNWGFLHIYSRITRIKLTYFFFSNCSRYISVEKMSPGDLMPCLHASVFLNATRGHRGTGRRATAAAPRGTVAHTKLPTTGLTREAQASRARGGAAGSPGYRPPLLAVTHESYNNYVSQILSARESSWSEICLRWMEEGGGIHGHTLRTSEMAIFAECTL